MGAQDSSRFNVKRMDSTCKPCEDFYQFVNGEWLKDNPVPSAYARWGTFQILQEDNLNVLRGILQDAAAAKPSPGGNEQIIGSFYSSCMDEAKIDAEGAAPVADELARIERIRGGKLQRLIRRPVFLPIHPEHRVSIIQPDAGSHSRKR